MCDYTTVRLRELSDDNSRLWLYQVDEHGNPAGLVDSFDHGTTAFNDLVANVGELLGRAPDVPTFICRECGLESDYWGEMLEHLEPVESV